MKLLSAKKVLAMVFASCLSALSWSDTGPDAAESSSETEGWRGAVEIYGYLPTIDNEFPDGTKSKLKAKDILKSLDMTFQAIVGLRKDKWLFALDAFYSDLSDDPGGTIGPLLDLQELSLKAWVINPTVSYRVIDNEDWSLELLGGARYYWLEVGLRTQELFPDFETEESNESEGIWDAVVGVRGSVELPGRWYLPYRFDVGAGDSDLTTQAVVGFAYEFDSFDLQFGFRHWGWQFGDGAPLKEQTWNGVYAGGLFRF